MGNFTFTNHLLHADLNVGSVMRDVMLGDGHLKVMVF